ATGSGSSCRSPTNRLKRALGRESCRTSHWTMHWKSTCCRSEAEIRGVNVRVGGRRDLTVRRGCTFGRDRDGVPGHLPAEVSRFDWIYLAVALNRNRSIVELQQMRLFVRAKKWWQNRFLPKHFHRIVRLSSAEQLP